ncbi:hypothetical protein KKG19_00585, partial [Patescibacteria group bacterium]|nr:hypothetical protein [Patescibacteria group bacterium]
LNNRRTQAPEEDLDADPFGEDGLVRILFIGLDSRAGQTAGHCDAIQFFEMDKNQGTVRITAVPRGTYSPLPPGLGTATGDYYISNACGLVGLDYGINQIEKVLGQQADYLVIVGFSRAVGIIRELQLPATETLQWLRHRQGYAIGEPQRAHNHSTFLKQMLVKFTPDEHSNLDVPFQYLMYNLLQTDLSFAQARAISHFLTDLELADHPEKIALAIKPEFAVQNIAYDADKVDAYLASMLNPIKGYLSSDDYSGKTEAEKETELLALIEEHGHDSEFVAWSYENKLWLQFEDEQQRMAVQFDLTARYAGSLPDLSAQTQVLDDYILEMEYRGLDEWSQKGQELRRQRLLVPLENLITDYLGTFLFRF